MSDATDRIVPIEPQQCSSCQGSLAGAAAAVADRGR